MGGFGSGGHNFRGRIVAEAVDRLDIRQVDHGRLDPGAPALTHRISTGMLRVALDWRSCRFGGSRPFLVCPGCCRTSLVLYEGGGRLLCRLCVRVTYTSQRGHRRERLWRAVRKLRVQLGQDPSHLVSLFDSIPERPYGMWQRTYDRLVQRLVAIENEILGLANTELRKPKIVDTICRRGIQHLRGRAK